MAAIVTRVLRALLVRFGGDKAVTQMYSLGERLGLFVVIVSAYLGAALVYVVLPIVLL